MEGLYGWHATRREQAMGSQIFSNIARPPLQLMSTRRIKRTSQSLIPKKNPLASLLVYLAIVLFFVPV